MSKKETLEKRRPERQVQSRVSSAETKVVWSIEKTWIQIHQTYLPNETRFDKTKGRVWNLIRLQEFWIHLTKFDTTTRKLNRQYDIQIAVTKTRFSIIRCHEIWYTRRKLDFWRRFCFLPYFSYVTWLYDVWH